MLGFKGFGFLIALVYTFFSTLSALKEFVLRYAWPYLPCLGKRPEDKLHDVIRRVMLQVTLASAPLFPVFCSPQSYTYNPKGQSGQNRLNNCFAMVST